MRRSWAIIILTTFAAITLFGFFAMGSHAGGHTSCIAAVGQQAICSHGNTLDSIVFHSRFFQRLTSSDSLAFLAVLGLIVLFATSRRLDIWKQLQTFWRQPRITSFLSLSDLQFAYSAAPLRAWLSLHEKVGPAVG